MVLFRLNSLKMSEDELLKLLIESPKLYLENNLNDLKNQVDLFYCIREEENNEWLKITEKIDSFKIECFKTLNNVKLKMTENLNEKELNDEIFKIKKIVFCNKTIQFLPKFKRLDSNIENSFLLIIEDEYLNQNISDINNLIIQDKLYLTNDNILTIIVTKHLLKTAEKKIENLIIVNIKSLLEFDLSSTNLCTIGQLETIGIFDQIISLNILNLS
jgi:hypothetical protein